MSRSVLRPSVRRSLPSRFLLVAIAAAVLFGGFNVLPAMGVPLVTAVPMNQQDTRMWMTSDIDGGTGTVSALDYASDGTLYIGGEFTHVGPPTGGFGAIGADGRISGAYPYVDGIVYASVADGSGGFYIGGDFDSVGGTARQNIARISADGTLDATWNPGASGVVNAMAIDANYLYVGGNFTTIGGQAYSRLARFVRSTGQISMFYSPTPNGQVRALAVSGSTLYVGGDFTSLGGASRNRLGAVTTSGGIPGQVTAWDPSPNGRVYAMAVYSDTLYVGGEFTQMGVTALSGIARFTISTGALVPTWNPVIAGGSVYAIAVQVPTDAASVKVLIGGSFLTVDTTARPRVAALYHANGELYDVWQPSPNSTVFSLLASGDWVYVGGAFSSAVPASLPPRLMRFSNDGNLLPDASAWAPMPVGNSVFCLTASGGDIGVGGNIASVGAHPRKNIAALDSTGALKTGWYPTDGANGPVRAIEVTSTGRVLVGGEFTSIGGQTRNRMAELNTSTGTPLSFNPNFNGTVYAIESRTGDPIYVGGLFTQVGGITSRWNLAALDTNGALTTWCSTGGADSTVRALALDGTGGAIYVGGDFADIAGSSRYRLARLATASTTVEAWDPALSGAAARVNDILVTSTAIYAGGQFTQAGGSARANLAALSPVNAAPASWAPNPNSEVHVLAKSGEADVIIIGGLFSTIGGQDRPRLAAVRPDGTVTSWRPEPNAAVAALAANDTGIVAGGGFAWLRGDSNTGMWQAPVRFPFDDVAPVGSISINGGAASTSSPSVTITISITDDSSLVTQGFGLSSGGPWSMPEPLSATRAYTLPAGDGAKTVWARFEDESGNVRITSDSITLTAPPSTPMPVYRFFRPSTGTHFYTASEDEKATVMATLGHIYSYEGVGYSINTANAANSTALYRFFRPSTGTHLYTADAGEKDTIVSTLSHIYSLDGVAYNVSMSEGTQVYRFYSPSKGVHFYSSDPSEIDYVRANLGHIWSYEGPAYRVAQ